MKIKGCGRRENGNRRNRKGCCRWDGENRKNRKEGRRVENGCRKERMMIGRTENDGCEKDGRLKRVSQNKEQKQEE